jgi:hypothetical protein
LKCRVKHPFSSIRYNRCLAHCKLVSDLLPACQVYAQSDCKTGGSTS